MTGSFRPRARTIVGAAATIGMPERGTIAVITFYPKKGFIDFERA